MNPTKKEITGTWKARRRQLLLLSDGRCSYKSQAFWLLDLMTGIAGAPGAADEDLSGSWDLVDGGLTLELKDRPLRFWKIKSYSSDRFTVVDEDRNEIEYSRA